jgi:hypothetical protein
MKLLDLFKKIRLIHSLFWLWVAKEVYLQKAGIDIDRLRNIQKTIGKPIRLNNS